MAVRKLASLKVPYHLGFLGLTLFFTAGCTPGGNLNLLAKISNYFFIGQPSETENFQSQGGFGDPGGFYSANGKSILCDGDSNRVLLWNQASPTGLAKADIILGQTSLNGLNPNSGGANIGISRTFGCWTDGNKVAVAEWYNRRVLLWNSWPTTNGQAPDVVLGQPDLSSTVNNAGGLSAASLSTTTSVYFDGTNLLVSDYGNHRVLIWNSWPTVNQQAANIVLGQPNMTSNTANNGGRSASTLRFPMKIWSDGTKVAIADYLNRRVLLWNAFPISNGQAANTVLGQVNFTSATDNSGGISASSISLPTGVGFNGTKFVMSDTGNHRVSIWNSWPSSNNQAADVVWGQTNSTTAGANSNSSVISALGVNGPYNVNLTASGGLSIVDRNNRRVLLFATVPTSNTDIPSILGQSSPAEQKSFSNPTSPTGSGLALYTMDFEVTDDKLVLVESSHHRVLIWNSRPKTTGFAPDLVIGQPSLQESVANNGGLSASSVNYPMGAALDDSGRLYVSDGNNSRVLIWNTFPTSNNQPADIVLGQPNFTTTTCNTGGLSATSLCYPTTLKVVGNKLIVADVNNARLMIWNSLPTSTNQAADLELGNPDFTSTTWTVSQSSFGYSEGDVWSDGNKIIFPDQYNHRILIWNSWPTVNGQSADLVLGQDDFTSSAANKGGAVSSSSLNTPTKGIVINGKLLIADYWNNRILTWNEFPTTNGQAADSVIGQNNFTSVIGGYFSSNPLSFSRPKDLEYISDTLYIFDGGNNRITGLKY